MCVVVLRAQEESQPGAVRPGSVLGLVFALLLHLHAPVLKPDLDLPLGQVEGARHLVPPVPREVHVEQKLLLQLQSLVFGVGTALLPRGARVEPVGRRVVCGKDTDREMSKSNFKRCLHLRKIALSHKLAVSFLCRQR